jgi:arylsulfatase A-like enzyme
MNVIFVMSDSFRRDHVGAFGNPWIRTPALDRFAAQSVSFPHFFTGSYPTIPQRTDLFTGRYSYGDRPWQPLKKEDVVLPEILSAAGVDTYLSADTPHLFRSAQMTFTRGFDGVHWSRGSEGDLWWTDFYNEQEYRPPDGQGRVRISEATYRRMWSQGRRRVSELDWVSPQTFQAAIEWLTRNGRRKSFFLYIDTFDPHEPWDPPRWASDLYGDPEDRGEPYAWAEYGSARQYGPRELGRLRARYAGECTLVDRWFGRLVDTVDLLGLGDRTMIVFTSDHGHYLGYPGDGGQVGKWMGYRRSDGKMAGADADVFVPLLDPVCRPPLIVRLPGARPGASRAELVQPVDLMPTVLEFLGAAAPDGLHGRSLLPLLRGRRVPWRPYAVTAAHGGLAQITDRRWLYGAWPHRQPPKLFDRESDPHQRRDARRAHPYIARRLHDRLVREMRAVGAPAEWVAQIEAKRPDQR